MSAVSLPGRLLPGRGASLRGAGLLLIALLAIAAGTAFELRVLWGRSADPAALHRVTAVALNAGAEARFALPGGDELLRLVTNGLPPAALAPGADLDYTLHVSVQTPDGTVVVSRDLGFRSRETLVTTAMGIQSSAVDPAGGRIADSRRLDLPLPGPQPPGTVVTLSAVGPVPALVRAWTREERSRADQRLRSFGEADASRASALLGVPSWDHLDEPERAALSRDRFVRLAALGRPGTDHQLQTFYTRAIDLNPAAEAVPDADATRGLVVPLQGPAALRVHLRAAAGTVKVSLRRTGAETQELGAWTLDALGEGATWEGLLPDGLHNLEIRSDGPVYASVEAPGTAHVPALADEAISPVEPVELRLEASPASATEPAVFDAEGPDEPLARLLDVELWGPPGRLAVGVRLLDAKGQATELRGEVELSASGFDVAVSEEGVASAIAGGARLRLLLPRQARTVEIRPAQDALVRFKVPLRTDLDEVSDPIAEDGEGLRLAHAGQPDPAPRWSTVRALSPERAVSIRTYARVEAVIPPPVPAEGAAAASLSPLSGAVRLAALEPVAPGETEHVLTEIPGDRVVRTHAPRGASRARLTYEVEDFTLLGRSVAVTLDGQPAGAFTPAMSRGTHRLPTLSPGFHTLAVDAPPGLRVYANLPPAPGDGAVASRQRTVWRFGPGPISLEVPAGVRAINVVIYDPSSGPRPDLVLSATIDGGAPRRREAALYTRLTPSVVRRSLPAASAPVEAHLVDGDRPSIGRARAVIIPLGDDLTPGDHRVTLRPSREITARFFSYPPSGAVFERSAEEDE